MKLAPFWLRGSLEWPPSPGGHSKERYPDSVGPGPLHASVREQAQPFEVDAGSKTGRLVRRVVVRAQLDQFEADDVASSQAVSDVTAREQRAKDAPSKRDPGWGLTGTSVVGPS